MWGWPHSSTSSAVTPSFQSSDQFSTSGFPVPHHSSPLPPTLSSQAGFPQIFQKYPPSDYNHSQQHEQAAANSYSSSSPGSGLSHSVHLPWSSGSCSHISSHKPVADPAHDMVVGGVSGSGNEASVTNPIDVGRSSQKVSSSGGVSNSPFSMDFILQKSVPVENTGMVYNEQYNYSNIPYQAPVATHHQAQSGSSYNKSHVTLPPLHQSDICDNTNLDATAAAGANVLHSSQSFHRNSPQLSQISSSNTFTEEPFHAGEKIMQQQFQYCPSAPTSALGSVVSGTLAPSEEPFSPPELVLKKAETRPQACEESKSDESSSKSSSLGDMAPEGSNQSLVEKQPSHPASFSLDEEEGGSSPPAHRGTFMSGGFQLGLSVPSPKPPPSNDSSNSSGSSMSSSVNEDDRENKSGDDSVSSSSSSSSSDNSSNSEDSTMDTAIEPAQEGPVYRGQVNEADPSPTTPPDCTAIVNTSTTTTTASMAIPVPPPLVPTHSLQKNEISEFDGDNDDVFLPASPVSSAVEGVKYAKKILSPKVEGSLILNEGERKTPSVVVGKRGRAAGKVLDEDKLRLPLANGWQRIVRTRLGENNGPTRVDICYVTPCKRRLRTFPEIQRYIDHNGTSNLSIENFSFSKKVNVGVVINEETLMNNANEELARPRRGRPPKHLKALKEMEKNKEALQLGQDTYRKDMRISLEPHEIGINSQLRPHHLTAPMTAESEEVMSSYSGNIHGQSGLPPSNRDDMEAVPKLIDRHGDQLPGQHPPPPLVSTERGFGGVSSANGILTADKRGLKRKSMLKDGKAPVFKKPRGRPKGSGNRSSTGSVGRKPRIPRTVKYIPPSLPIDSGVVDRSGHLAMNGGDSAIAPQDEGGSFVTTSENTRIKKQLEDKEKRRKLLIKAREGGGGRRKSGNNSLQRSQRKLAQQARRERERIAKHKQNVILKQKEVEMEEIRKSRAARQKESEYRQQALERTRNLMEQLKKQDEERERMLRLRQLDLEKAEQLRRPTEDLLVKNLTSLPALPRVELVSLSSEAFLNLVTVFQFVNSFEDFLDLESVPQFIDLYCGLFNARLDDTDNSENDVNLVVTPNEKDSVLEVLIQMVKAVIHDPGTKTQTLTGCSLRDVEVKEQTVSEILRLFLSKVPDTTIQKICSLLEHIPFCSLCPSHKTRVLSFLIEELLRSSSLCKEIDNRMEQVCTLRRIKWKISLKLKRFRSRFNEVFGADTPTKAVLYSGRGRPPKKFAVNLPNDVESSDEEGDGGGGNGDDPSNLSDDESDYTDEDSDEEPSEDKEELLKRIKEMKKKIVCIRSRISTASKQMRVFPLGQDRFSRQYWSLPKMGGVLVEGIETSTFDPLEKYISEVTYRREIKKIKDKMSLKDIEEVGTVDDLAGKNSLEPSVSPSVNTKQQSCDPPSVQHSDSEVDSRMAVVGVDTYSTPEFTPDSSPPLSNSLKEGLGCSPEKQFKSNAISNHPLEMQQFANTSTNAKTSSASYFTETRATTERSFGNDSNAVANRQIQSRDSTSSIPWFSLLPRKQCEVLHYLQLDPGQQQGVMMAPQFLGGGGGYAYISPGNTVLGQPIVQQVQMGYALMGNNLVQVPQTQYVVAGQTGSTIGGGNQLISLGNGQFALAPGASSGIQYVSINGNQYAIMQAPDQQEAKPDGAAITSSFNIGSVPTEAQSHSLGPQTQSLDNDSALNNSLTQENTGSKKEENHKTQTSSSLSVNKKLKQKSVSPVPTSHIEEQQPQQLLTLAIPGNNGEDPQYVQVPADPRVLSGECSYAVLPQADGSSQIVLVEKSSLGVADQAPPQSDETVAMECPHAVVMDNEYECNPWCVDITLMYADSPLPFANEGELQSESQTTKESHKDNEEKLSQLLEQVDKDLTHGWWNITDPVEMEHLIRCLTMRGYREKSLHKVLTKNKEIICHTMTNAKINLPESLTHKLQSLVTQSLKQAEQEDVVIENNNPVKNEPTMEDSDEMEVDITNVQSQDQDTSTGSPLAKDEQSCLSHPMKKLVLPGDDTTEWDPCFPSKIREKFVKLFKYLEGMEARLFDAHLPVEGSQKTLIEYPADFNNEAPLSLTSCMALISLISDGLLRLEGSVQRRYLKRPFKEKHGDIKKTSPTNGSPTPTEDPPALVKWRSAVGGATSASQLGVCINQLERCIAWEKSPMKVFCVVCRTGDNESLLLLCDKCDRGTHTYCCKPKLDNIPEGNWYCHDCVINASRKTVCNVCETARGVLLHCTECPTVIHKRCHNPPLTRVPNGPWLCFSCRRQNRRSKSNHMKDELIICYELLKELEDHEDSWPFLQPVDKKKVPGYYKVIKKAMDFSTVKSKLLDGRYATKEAFSADTRLVFDNCSFYNEDDSEIGIAGYRMKQFFEKKWAELSWS